MPKVAPFRSRQGILDGKWNLLLNIPSSEHSNARTLLTNGQFIFHRGEYYIHDRAAYSRTKLVN